MLYENLILGEMDDFLRHPRQISASGNVSEREDIPEKFRDDIERLAIYVGNQNFISGLCIELSLSDILSIVPRQRRRTDAYDALVKYLKNERNITLTIKSNKI